MSRVMTGLLSFGLLASGCVGESGEPPAPDQTADTSIPSAEASQEAVSFVYDKLAEYSEGTGHPIQFRVSDFQMGDIEQIRGVEFTELVTVLDDGYVDGTSTKFQMGESDRSVLYKLGWEDGPRYPAGSFEEMTLSELLAADGFEDRRTGEYITYRVEMTLDGRTESYEAIWIQLEGADEVRDLYPVDLVVGNGNIRKALRDAFSGRTSTFKSYGTIRPQDKPDVAYNHAPCPGKFWGAKNAGSEKKKTGHTGWAGPLSSSGYHWFEWHLQGFCTYRDIDWGCAADCGGTATSSSGEVGMEDGYPITCHYISDDANYGTGSADPNSSVTCSGAAMAVVKSCTCLLGCSVQVRVLPMGVGVVIEADSGYDSFGPKPNDIVCSGIPHNEG